MDSHNEMADLRDAAIFFPQKLLSRKPYAQMLQWQFLRARSL
ncbi:hypothetical protein [Granulosicoccus antarcticus]|uniref:Uncharacterized protein n=1 Tax=Granulosicoccus antarcticus IMCC3135 TaxID=1192854 RepID=A0A2Z2NYM3_9GAMM|nr:hypothetical protein [Granulosicoccus antarcticus]ASJ72244.1 hypothetical protein IMCC3135_10760 [Granulosicoccus antarcticus IMCC3135]